MYGQTSQTKILGTKILTPTFWGTIFWADGSMTVGFSYMPTQVGARDGIKDHLISWNYQTVGKTTPNSNA